MNAIRSNRMIITGAAVFVIGAGLTLVGLRSSDASDTPAPKTPTTAQDPTVGRNAGNERGFQLPERMEAVGLAVEGAPGLSGYAGRGDLVNIYGTVKSASGQRVPFARRILSSVRVLDVTAPVRAGRGETNYLLALSHKDAEKLIFVAKFESVWLTLARSDQGNVDSAGHNYANTF